MKNSDIGPLWSTHREDWRPPPGGEGKHLSPATKAAIRRLSTEQRRQFMEAAHLLSPGSSSSDRLAALDHYERSASPELVDALWKAASEVDPTINRRTRANTARSHNRRFDVIVRSLATLEPPTTAPAAGGLLTTVEGRAVPYGTFSNVGYYLESHAYGSLDGSTGPGMPALPLMLNHGRSDEWPIGRSVSWRNQIDGLHGVWQLNDSDTAQRAGRSAANGELGFMSISFQPIRSEWQMAEDWNPDIGNYDKVTRLESRLLETSIVATPAFADARVIAVRSATTRQRHADITDEYPGSPIAWKILADRLHRQHRPAQTRSDRSTVAEWRRYLQTQR